MFSFFHFVCILSTIFEVVITGEDKKVIVQNPVQIHVGSGHPLTTLPPISPLKTRVVVVHNNMVPVPIECFQPPDSGTCSKDLARIYYDHETRTCKPFSYTGCSGNANRFQSIKNCYRICHPYRYKVRPKIAKQKTGSNRKLKVKLLPAQRLGHRALPMPFGQNSGQQNFYGAPAQQQNYGAPQQQQFYGAPAQNFASQQQNYGAPVGTQNFQAQQQQQAQFFGAQNYGAPAGQQAQNFASQNYGAPQQQQAQNYGAPQQQGQQNYGGLEDGQASVMTPEGAVVKNQKVGNANRKSNNSGKVNN